MAADVALAQALAYARDLRALTAQGLEQERKRGLGGWSHAAERFQNGTGLFGRRGVGIDRHAEHELQLTRAGVPGFRIAAQAARTGDV